MGWFGYGIYDGDETQTCHYAYLHWAKVESNERKIDKWLTLSGTILPEDKRHLLVKNYNLILKKLKKPKFWDEESALEWQMLLTLFVDNNLAAPDPIYDNGVQATEFLMDQHAEEFDSPKKRKNELKKFLTKAEKLKNTTNSTSVKDRSKIKPIGKLKLVLNKRYSAMDLPIPEGECFSDIEFRLVKDVDGEFFLKFGLKEST